MNKSVKTGAGVLGGFFNKKRKKNNVTLQIINTY